MKCSQFIVYIYILGQSNIYSRRKKFQDGHLGIILQKTYKIYDCDIQFETQDITMKYRDGTKFIANVYENGELVTKTDIDYSIGATTYTGTLLFTILQTGTSYCRRFINSDVALNLNMQPGEYDIITTYKTHDKEYTVTNHISIS